MYLRKKFFIALAALTTTLTTDAKAQISSNDMWSPANPSSLWNPANPNSYNNMMSPNYILRDSSDKKDGSSEQQEKPSSPASCERMLNDMLKEGSDRYSIVDSWKAAQCSPANFEDRENHPVWALARRHRNFQLNECYQQAGNPPYQAEEIKACIMKIDNKEREGAKMLGYMLLSLAASLFVAGGVISIIEPNLDKRKKRKTKTSAPHS